MVYVVCVSNDPSHRDLSFNVVAFMVAPHPPRLNL